MEGVGGAKPSTKSRVVEQHKKYVDIFISTLFFDKKNNLRPMQKNVYQNRNKKINCSDFDEFFCAFVQMSFTKSENCFCIRCRTLRIFLSQNQKFCHF